MAKKRPWDYMAARNEFLKAQKDGLAGGFPTHKAVYIRFLTAKKLAFRDYPNAKLMMKSTASTTSVAFKSRQRPVNSLVSTNVRMPKQMPSAML